MSIPQEQTPKRIIQTPKRLSERTSDAQGEDRSKPRRPSFGDRKPGRPRRVEKPDFLANGIVEGKIIVEPHVQIETTDGANLRLSGIDPTLSIWMLGHMSEWAAAQQHRWFIYPQSSQKWLLKALVSEGSELSDRPVDQFQVHGSVKAVKPGKLVIYVGRNIALSKSQRSFQFIDVYFDEGTLEAQEQQFVKLRCKRVGDRLIVLTKQISE